MENRLSNDARSCTRRQLLRMAAATATAGPLLTALACHKEKASLGTTFRMDAWCQTSTSIFCLPCTMNNPKKGYDNDASYGLFALWLMLTTEDWSGFLADRERRKLLAGDFNISGDQLEWLYNRMYNADGTRKQITQNVQAIWQKFRKEELELTNFYPGGGALLQIARKFDATLPPSPVMPEAWPGTPGSANMKRQKLGQPALWLMLITEPWAECITEKPAFLAGLPGELGISDAETKYLLQQSPATFQSAQIVWGQFLTYITTAVYGGHACPGGRTLLQISAGGS